jgi:YHS domain-containing protein
VTRWPTDVIVTPAGLEVYRAISPQRPADYIALVNQVAVQTGTGAGRTWTPDKNPTMQRGGENAAGGPAPTNAAVPTAGGQVAIESPQDAGQPNVLSRRSSFVPVEGGSVNSSSAASYVTPEIAAPPAQASGPAPQPAIAKIQASLPTENPWFTAASSVAPAMVGAEVNPPQAQATGREFVPPTQTTQPQAAIPQPAADAQRPEEQSYFSPQSAQAAASPQAAANFSSGPASSVTPTSAPRANEGRQMIPADQAPPVALEGQCPVTFAERGTWSKGDPLYGVIHEGQTYLFVTAAEQQRFLANPAQYMLPPVGLEGFCPVTLRDQMRWQKADRQHFAVHRGRMYFFATPAERERFLSAPDAYAPVLSGFDSVRFAHRGELVEGKRAFGLLTKDKQIYLFADQQALETFEQNPTVYQDRVRQAMVAPAAPTSYR